MSISLGKITHPEGAELQLDSAPADWIADRLLPWGAEVGTRVCAIVPVGYEAYLRVFHHAEEHVGSESIRRRWSELAQRSGRQMHPAVQFDRFAWPNPPQEGSLDRQEATAMVSLLRGHTTTPNHCWLAIWHGFGQLTGSVQVHAVGGRGGSTSMVTLGRASMKRFRTHRGGSYLLVRSFYALNDVSSQGLTQWRVCFLRESRWLPRNAHGRVQQIILHTE